MTHLNLSVRPSVLYVTHKRSDFRVSFPGTSKFTCEKEFWWQMLYFNSHELFISSMMIKTIFKGCQNIADVTETLWIHVYYIYNMFLQLEAH